MIMDDTSRETLWKSLRNQDDVSVGSGSVMQRVLWG